MRINKAIKFVFLPILSVSLLLLCGSCKKLTHGSLEQPMLNPPVRTYIVIARIDKKGTNSNSNGTAILRGTYDEKTKLLTYALEYTGLIPELITFRNGTKGTVGSLIKEIFRRNGENDASIISGSMILSPLQERFLLRGQWFVAINTLVLSPEISGYLVLKRKKQE